MPSPILPSLYGLTAANSTRHGASLWGKNQFNSMFPLALCIYMRDKGFAPVAVVEENGLITTDNRRWEMTEVLGSSNCRYLLETAFFPYTGCVRGTLDKIDLVVSVGGKQVRPLEVKLTVVPDISTVAYDESG